ncbi:hypothetical protein [Streptomyces sp. ok210]|uniref:hypothetical protein n=1 Tax=Streptomyces sp. ok210 TaxID=1761905 RepID=UPI0008E0FE20|nr:hypothetical protein [Streptomyces sp. ok210]SFT31787.1 hypothetical protein SAMN04487982_1242 [Streptomyces sp. ok210]
MAYAEKVYKVRNGKQTKQFTWKVRYKKPDGSRGTESGFPTKKTAEDWGDAQEAAIRAGRWVDPALQRMTFGEFAHKWMKAKPKRGNTVDKRWNLLQQHIFPKWEHTPLLSFNWFDVDTWQQGLACDDVTAGHAVSLMSSILTGAVDSKHIAVNPLFGRRRTHATGSAPTARRKSDEEKWAPPEGVLQLAERLGPAIGLHVLTTAFTGLGWGEGAALHRDNVLRSRRQPYDGGWFECPVIRVDPDVGELAEYSARDEDGSKTGLVLKLEPPKNGNRARDIDVPPFLALLLRRHLNDWPHPYVFCTPSGTFWRRSNFTRRHIRPAADGREPLTVTKGRAERPGWDPIMPGLTMRALRHTHDTYQDQIGVRPALMFEQAGHARPGIKAVYQHPTPAMRQERLDGLQEIYERAMGNLGWETLWGRVSLKKAPREDRPPNIPQTGSTDEELAA